MMAANFKQPPPIQMSFTFRLLPIGELSPPFRTFDPVSAFSASSPAAFLSFPVSSSWQVGSATREIPFCSASGATSRPRPHTLFRRFGKYVLLLIDAKKVGRKKGSYIQEAIRKAESDGFIVRPS